MKKSTVFAMAIAASVVLVGCGGSDDPFNMSNLVKNDGKYDSCRFNKLEFPGDIGAAMKEFKSKAMRKCFVLYPTESSDIALGDCKQQIESYLEDGQKDAARKDSGIFSHLENFVEALTGLRDTPGYKVEYVVSDKKCD